MTRDDIQRIMDEVPGLNDFGIGVYDSRRKKPAEREKELAEGKRDLLNSVDACTKCCEWLQQIEKIKSINARHSSYGLKHFAEDDISYITNGVFITAAIHFGFKYKLIPGNPNVLFAMSEKSINAARKRTEERKEGQRSAHARR